MEMSFKILWLVFLFLPKFRCEVHLKVILQPPWATLECVITHPNQVASAILMCPNDLMCFLNCDRLCDADNCKSNNITCSFEEIGSLKKFVYVFNASNSRNQGEWTCHYGTDKGSSAIFYVDSNPAHTKREIQIVEPQKSTVKLKQIKDSIDIRIKSTVPTIGHPNNLKRNTPKPLLANVNPYYVILLLLIFSISLLINIIFLVRDILTSISTRKSINRSDGKKYSYWLSMCIKLFCVERLYKLRQAYKTNPLSNEVNPLISRQVSSNLYEYPTPFHFQTPILFENVAYASTPGNERMHYANNCMRSKSYPLKNNDAKGYTSNSVQLGGNKDSQTNSTMELTNQIIYDDVADPSIHYVPIDNPIYSNSLVRSNHRLNRHLSARNHNQLSALSMTNLNLKSKYHSNSVIGITDSNDGTLLKDAINCRVELSKEMINQADSLLRQADDLLNRKDSPRSN